MKKEDFQSVFERLISVSDRMPTGQREFMRSLHQQYEARGVLSDSQTYHLERLSTTYSMEEITKQDKFEKEWYLSSESISNINVYTNEKPSSKTKEDRETKSVKGIIELNTKVMKSSSNLSAVTLSLYGFGGVLGFTILNSESMISKMF